MDFGLHGLLDRIERDFGPKWAKALTLLITLALIAGCLTVVGNLISAFSLWMSGITSESSLWAKILYVGKYVVGIALLVTVANNLAFVTTAKHRQASILRQSLETSNLLKQADELVEQSKGGDAMLQENLAMFEDIVKTIAETTGNEALSAKLWEIHGTIVRRRTKKVPLN